MRLGNVGRAKRVAIGIGVFTALSSALWFESERARAAVDSRDLPETARDKVEPASDAWRGGRHPVWLTPESSSDGPVLVYPPSSTAGPAPLVVMLHGMCGHPENECPWFAGRATGDRYLACPRADLGCAGGGTIWSGGTRTRAGVVGAARTRVEQAFDGKVSSAHGATLVGFSLGAFVALDVAESSHAEWKRLLLISAFVKPNAKKLKAAGVESVLLASGDWDMSRDEMKRQARALARQGIRARYVGMGPVGHWFAKDMDSWLADAFEWLERDEEHPDATSANTAELKRRGAAVSEGSLSFTGVFRPCDSSRSSQCPSSRAAVPESRVGMRRWTFALGVHEAARTIRGSAVRERRDGVPGLLGHRPGE